MIRGRTGDAEHAVLAFRRPGGLANDVEKFFFGDKPAARAGDKHAAFRDRAEREAVHVVVGAAGLPELELVAGELGGVETATLEARGEARQIVTSSFPTPVSICRKPTAPRMETLTESSPVPVSM